MGNHRRSLGHSVEHLDIGFRRVFPLALGLALLKGLVSRECLVSFNVVAVDAAADLLVAQEAVLMALAVALQAEGVAAVAALLRALLLNLLKLLSSALHSGLAFVILALYAQADRWVTALARL